MRRYMIWYRRGRGVSGWGRLTPSVHQGLYDKPEITAAVAFLRDNPATEVVAIRLGDEMYKVVVTLDTKAENSFPLGVPC